jgi:hypothetical protein
MVTEKASSTQDLHSISFLLNPHEQPILGFKRYTYIISLFITQSTQAMQIKLITSCRQ